MAIYLYPLNDLSLEVKLKTVNSETGAKEALTTGTVTAFLATANTPTASAADATLSVSCVHIGSGKWLAQFDGATLTATLLNTLFSAATPYCIVQAAGDIRAYVELTYSASREATVS